MSAMSVPAPQPILRAASGGRAAYRHPRRLPESLAPCCGWARRAWVPERSGFDSCAL